MEIVKQLPYIVKNSKDIGPLLQKIHEGYFDEIEQGKEKYLAVHLDSQKKSFQLS